MKTFACGQVVAGCDGVVTGATDDEVLAAAAKHAAEAHGMNDVPEEVVTAIRAGIVEASAPPLGGNSSLLMHDPC